VTSASTAGLANLRGAVAISSGPPLTLLGQTEQDRETPPCDSASRAEPAARTDVPRHACPAVMINYCRRLQDLLAISLKAKGAPAEAPGEPEPLVRRCA
jgi:hypothetical protein